MTPTRNPLANGLRVLQLLVDADEARSATDLARTAGMHQSSVSRILQTLAEAGFARKVGPHRFAPDAHLVRHRISSHLVAEKS